MTSTGLVMAVMVPRPDVGAGEVSLVCGGCYVAGEHEVISRWYVTDMALQAVGGAFCMNCGRAVGDWGMEVLRKAKEKREREGKVKEGSDEC